MKAKKVTGRLARVPGVHFKSSSNKVMKTLPANYFKNVSKDEMAAYHKGQLAEFYQRQKEMKREDQAACLLGLEQTWTVGTWRKAWRKVRRTLLVLHQALASVHCFALYSSIAVFLTNDVRGCGYELKPEMENGDFCLLVS